MKQKSIRDVSESERPGEAGTENQVKKMEEMVL